MNSNEFGRFVGTMMRNTDIPLWGRIIIMVLMTLFVNLFVGVFWELGIRELTDHMTQFELIESGIPFYSNTLKAIFPYAVFAFFYWSARKNETSGAELLKELDFIEPVKKDVSETEEKDLGYWFNMKEKGAISEEEYERKKREYL